MFFKENAGGWRATARRVQYQIQVSGDHGFKLIVFNFNYYGFKADYKALIVFNLIASEWWCTPWWPSAGCSSSWKGGDRHSILVAAQHDHHQLQWSPSHHLLITISMASKIPWRWKKSKRLGKKFEGRATSLEVIIAVTLTFIVSKSSRIFLSNDFYDQQNLQAESIVKERHVTEEKSSPVPNLFQLRPKW